MMASNQAPDLPKLTLAEADAAVAAQTAPKVTTESITAKIAAVHYLTHGRLTIALITMRNGFVVLGKSAAVSPENDKPEAGQRYAYEDAFQQLWQLEAYLLREELSR
jgi:hypothetical protein